MALKCIKEIVMRRPESAKSKGLNNPGEYMYMYSKDGLDYFKNINFRNYINFKI